MKPRKNTKLVTFETPFQLQAMEEMQPAGDYEITVEQEQIGEFMFEAFRRTPITLYLPPRDGDYGMGRVVPVEPAEFAELVKLKVCSPDRT
jgi:hypothetical protein